MYALEIVHKRSSCLELVPSDCVWGNRTHSQTIIYTILLSIYIYIFYNANRNKEERKKYIYFFSA